MSCTNTGCLSLKSPSSEFSSSGSISPLSMTCSYQRPVVNLKKVKSAQNRKNSKKKLKSTIITLRLKFNTALQAKISSKSTLTKTDTI